MASDDKNRVVNLGDAELNLDEALARALEIQVRGFTSSQQPDLGGVKQVILQEGKYVTKMAVCWDIRDRHDDKYKFTNLRLITLRRTKKRGWEFELHHSITLGDSKNPDVIKKLTKFLQSLPKIDTTEDVIVFGAKAFDSEKFKQALQAVSGTGRSAEVLSEVLSWINADAHALENLAQLSSDDLLRSQSLVAAINYGRYHRALSHFAQMIEDDLPEPKYQKFLEENQWIFGSEYSELLPKRNFVVGQQLDFPLRRTVDGYLDVIEIKTPLDRKSGFIRDTSHSNYYPGGDIRKYHQQVLSYIRALEKNRDSIMLDHKIDVTKTRGKLIIGRDGSDAIERDRRLFNDEQKTVEVISFDGLLRIGQRILDVMATQHPALKAVDLSNIKSA